MKTFALTAAGLATLVSFTYAVPNPRPENYLGDTAICAPAFISFLSAQCQEQCGGKQENCIKQDVRFTELKSVIYYDPVYDDPATPFGTGDTAAIQPGNSSTIYMCAYCEDNQSNNKNKSPASKNNEGTSGAPTGTPTGRRTRPHATGHPQAVPSGKVGGNNNS
ncbi:MAG: hypothetical protein Q9227_007585 [Pyrenula ochraceoflavens]